MCRYKVIQWQSLVKLQQTFPSFLVLFPLFCCLLTLWMLSGGMGRSCHFALALSFSASNAHRCRSWAYRHTGGESADWSAGVYVIMMLNAKGLTQFSRTSVGGKLCVIPITCGLFSFIDSTKIGIGFRKHFKCIKSLANIWSRGLFPHTSSNSFCTGLTSLY